MRRRCHCALGLALVCGLALPRPAAAIVQWEGEEASTEVIGALRLLGGFMHYPEAAAAFTPGDDALSTAVLRLLTDGDLPGELSYEINLYADAARSSGTGTGGVFSSAGSFRSPYRTAYLEWDFWQAPAVAGQIGLDRLSLTRGLGPVDVTLGRFAVNHSVTSVFTPNDLFAPFSAAAINKIYKPGVDGARMSMGFGAMSGIEVTGVLGSGRKDHLRWGQSAVLARANTVLGDFEWAALGGKVARRWVAGASAQGEILQVGVRAEGHVGLPDKNGDGNLDDLDGDGSTRDEAYGRLAVGIDKMFVWQNAVIGAEYAYFSDGSGSADGYLARALRLFPDDPTYLGRHYAGASAGFEITPLVRAGLVALVNLGDGSGLAVASLLYSIADEADFAGGLLLPWGERPGGAAALPVLRSEMGSAPIAGFLETRFFF